jgi:hypothetical protein
MRIASLLLVLVLAASVSAGPHKVIVLPLDGNADAAAKTKLNAIVQNLAKSIPGTVASGDTTLAETASAVGCDPNKTACIDTVLTTLSVDEVVWGTATTENGQTRVVVRRATKGTPAQSQTAIVAAEKPESAEPGLSPLFGGTSVAITTTNVTNSEAGSAAGSASAPPSPPPPPATPATPWSSRKKLGVGLAIGGGALVLLGAALWANESGVQTDINNAPDSTPADIAALKDLESKANGYAWGGNIAMVLGLGAGGYGAYLLWKDYKEHAIVTPAPPPSGTGMTFVLRGSW